MTPECVSSVTGTLDSDSGFHCLLFVTLCLRTDSRTMKLVSEDYTRYQVKVSIAKYNIVFHAFRMTLLLECLKMYVNVCIL